ncbi:MAG: DUF3300 domain-containing protein [Myxococcota bacterium]|nr:DUF3300 domain-containing protein [Myxococcota bacterium]
MTRTRSPMRSLGEPTLVVLLALLAWIPAAQGAKSDTKTLSTEQLDQLVAPIALYPDSLIAQVLMASTYPLEIVEAARWVKANPKLEGKQLEAALQKESWDASVKSLTAFPQTLEMMNDKLDWTTQLGNAFLAQQSDVMSAIQGLRKRAEDAGNLKSNDQQTVTVEDKPTGNQSQTIIIQPANPEVVYVPTYNPTVVYGVWPYPAYAPFYWYPPGYRYASSAISFGMGMAVGAALWGNCNWGRSEVNINVNRYNNFNRTNITNNTWKHDNTHRRGVGYGDRNLQNRYGDNSAQRQKARDSFRGHAEKGRQQIAQGNADRFKGAGSGGGSFGGKREGANTRQGGFEQNRAGARQQGQSRWGDGAFGGAGNGVEARRNSNRGRASRDSFGGGGGGWGGGRGGGRHFGGGRRR